jgi:hypothetical protein
MFAGSGGSVSPSGTTGCLSNVGGMTISATAGFGLYFYGLEGSVRDGFHRESVAFFYDYLSRFECQYFRKFQSSEKI